MAKHRLYIPESTAKILAHSSIHLDDATRHYALNVLRLRDATAIEIFDGNGNAYRGLLRVKDKRTAMIEVGETVSSQTESSLRIELIQTLARGEKMDWIIQKAVELGAHSIRPITSERCNVKLDEKRTESRHKHWLGIISNACEQCGRDTLPTLHKPTNLNQLTDESTISSKHRWLFHPGTDERLNQQKIENDDSISVLIGPEGGFSDAEIEMLREASFIPLNMGPRILRTETAAIASISAIQSLWGDI